MQFNFVFAVLASISVTSITAMPHAISDVNDSLVPRNLPQEAHLNPRTTSEPKGGVQSTNRLEARYFPGGGTGYSHPTTTKPT